MEDIRTILSYSTTMINLRSFGLRDVSAKMYALGSLMSSQSYKADSEVN